MNAHAYVCLCVRAHVCVCSYVRECACTYLCMCIYACLMRTFYPRVLNTACTSDRPHSSAFFIAIPVSRALPEPLLRVTRPTELIFRLSISFGSPWIVFILIRRPSLDFHSVRRRPRSLGSPDLWALFHLFGDSLLEGSDGKK